MTLRTLVWRGLTHYWRTNLAVVLGVATAVAVLSGALLVGDSVRGSLRALVLDRLGRTDAAVLSGGYVRERLAADMERAPSLSARSAGVAPLLLAQGFVTGQESGRRVGRVAVYGVDDRFWRFHGVEDVDGPQPRDAYVSPALAEELAAAEGAVLLVRVQKPSDVPLESLHGRKDDLGRTVRLTVSRVLGRDRMGEFSLQPQQGDVRAVFVSLSRLQEDLEIGGRVNALLVSDGSRAQDDVEDLRPLIEGVVREQVALDDLGLRVRALGTGEVVVEAAAGLLTDAQAEAATAAAGQSAAPRPLLTYLADTIRGGERDVPFSLVTALDLATLLPGFTVDPAAPLPPIVLNSWTVEDLQIQPGAKVTLAFEVWEEPGRLVPRSADFLLAGVVPVDAADREMAPPYPGITDSTTLADWDPPFPIDLRRVRPIDERYWEAYRTTPKAFIPLEIGQLLWRSRYGALTSVRVTPPPGAAPGAIAGQVTADLRDRLDPLVSDLVVRSVRQDALGASRGATDFGQYFVYFSFFLVIAALVMASLFFKLGVEQRAREVGLLRAVGYRTGRVRRLLLLEGLTLSIVGGVAGVAGGVAYAALLMYGLRTWWVDAVGTTALELHVTATSLAAGGAAGVAAALLWTWWTLRSLAAVSERGLLAGDLAAPAAAGGQPAGRWLAASVVASAAAAGLVAGGLAGAVGQVGAFFGAGGLLLIALLALVAWRCRRGLSSNVEGHGWRPVTRLGVRQAAFRPGRTVLSMAVIASATFILISVDALRRDDAQADPGPSSGTGGYEVVAETLLPVVYDLSTTEGREALNLTALEDAVIEPFRLLPGDDASCLNLYQPTHPRLIGVREAFIQRGRFAFQTSLASTDAERANPWLLLNRSMPDGAVPVIADANSLTYVLHRGLGDTIVIDGGAEQVTLRVVAVLRDSLFQSELLMSEPNFTRLYPEQDGYRLLLVDAPAGRAAAAETELEDTLADFGADATATSARLAEFHRVENTYLSTFQTLGGLGLLLGTVGLAAVMMRNVLERRRELALLGAVGYRRRHLMLMVLAEQGVIVVGGLLVGAISALVAIGPAAVERGSRVPLTSGAALLVFAVAVTGLLAGGVATRLAVSGPLLHALRSE